MARRRPNLLALLAGLLAATPVLVLGPVQAEDLPELLEREIEHDLSSAASRAGAPSASSVDLFQTGRQLQITRQRLDTLETWTPQNPALPVLERRLDQLERPIGVGRPPVGARDPLPPRALGGRGGFEGGGF